MSEYDRVTLRVKVNDRQMISTGKSKQEISITDNDGFTIITL